MDFRDDLSKPKPASAGADDKGPDVTHQIMVPAYDPQNTLVYPRSQHVRRSGVGVSGGPGSSVVGRFRETVQMGRQVFPVGRRDAVAADRADGSSADRGVPSTGGAQQPGCVEQCAAGFHRGGRFAGDSAGGHG